MTFLSLTNATKHFNRVNAIDNLSLSVEQGEFVVLLGPSGCGKTTCLRLLAGFERPDAGTIQMGGRILASPSTFVPPEKRGISVVFQSYALWPHMGIQENVGYGLKVQGVSKAEIARRVNEQLDLVQLTAQKDRAPHQLSGGQQQRVALARALVTKPSTLLLDEPLSNLDTRLREEMRVELWKLQRMLNVTTVYVTHDQSEALSLADRVVVMNHGQIEQQGTPEEVYLRPRTRYVARALGSANIVPVTVKFVDGDVVGASGPGGIEVTALAALGGGRVEGVVNIAFRPSDAEIVPDSAGNAEVQNSLFFGTHVQSSVVVDGWKEPVSVLVPPERAVAPGTKVRLSIRDRAAAVLAPDRATPRDD